MGEPITPHVNVSEGVSMDKIKNLPAIIGGVSLAATTLLLFVAVLTRYFHVVGIPWVEEFARLAFVWLTFTGAAAATLAGKHVTLSTLVKVIHRRNPLGAKILRVFGMACFFIIAVLVSITAIPVVQMTWRQLTPIMRLPQGLFYLAAVIGGGLVAIFLVVKIFETLREEVK